MFSYTCFQILGETGVIGSIRAFEDINGVWHKQDLVCSSRFVYEPRKLRSVLRSAREVSHVLSGAAFLWRR
jgi:hypothetical protein